MEQKYPYFSKQNILRDLQAKKASIRHKLGQNFLIDPNYVRKIIQVIETYIPLNETILEIGPGLGVLTHLLQKKYFLECVEIDPVLSKILEEEIIDFKRTKIYNMDILEYLEKTNGKYYQYILGNIPYYITTDIILSVIKKAFLGISIFLVQKEYAEKIVSLNNSISIFIHNFATVKILFKVPTNAFFPVPSVESGLILLESKTQPESPPEILEKLLRMSYRTRRKKIMNSWQSGESLLSVDTLKKLATDIQFDVNERAEEIQAEKFYELANRYSKLF